MKPNLSTLDRIIRTAVAVLILVLYFRDIVSGIGGNILFLLAAMLLFTAIIAYSPLYSLLKIKTNREK